MLEPSGCAAEGHAQGAVSSPQAGAEFGHSLQTAYNAAVFISRQQSTCWAKPTASPMRDYTGVQMLNPHILPSIFLCIAIVVTLAPTDCCYAACPSLTAHRLLPPLAGL